MREEKTVERNKKLLLMNNNNNNNNNNTLFFNINDHPDILVEVLKRLDDRSLSVAACVCRLWCNISLHDSLWENLCFRHVSPPPSDIRHVVLALGGYRKLYSVCLRPLLSRLCSSGSSGEPGSGRFVGSVRTRHEVQLSLSLFSIDFYERLGGGGGGGGGGGVSSSSSSSSSSLMFLCKPVNV